MSRDYCFTTVAFGIPGDLRIKPVISLVIWHYFPSGQMSSTFCVIHSARWCQPVHVEAGWQVCRVKRQTVGARLQIFVEQRCDFLPDHVVDFQDGGSGFGKFCCRVKFRGTSARSSRSTLVTSVAGFTWPRISSGWLAAV